MIKTHNSGFVEIETDHTTLVLTGEEYHHALRRGLSVKANRITADRLATERTVSAPSFRR